MNLEIGSGESPCMYMEYIHSDIRNPMPHQEICFDMVYLPFKSNTLDYVVCQNSIEHIPMNQVRLALSEMYRVLKENCDVFLVCPNLLYIAKMLQVLPLNEVKDICILTIYGGQDYNENFHKSGFTPELMKQELELVGFMDVKITEHETYFIHARGTKYGQSSISL